MTTSWFLKELYPFFHMITILSLSFQTWINSIFMDLMLNNSWMLLGILKIYLEFEYLMIIFGFNSCYLILITISVCIIHEWYMMLWNSLLGYKKSDPNAVDVWIFRRMNRIQQYINSKSLIKFYADCKVCKYENRIWLHLLYSSIDTLIWWENQTRADTLITLSGNFLE